MGKRTVLIRKFKKYVMRFDFIINRHGCLEKVVLR